MYFTVSNYFQSSLFSAFLDKSWEGPGLKATLTQNLNKTDNFGHVITSEGPQVQAVQLEIADPRVLKNSDTVPLNIKTNKESMSVIKVNCDLTKIFAEKLKI